MERTNPGLKLGVDRNGLYIVFYVATEGIHTIMTVHAIPIADAIAREGPSLAHVQTLSKLEMECFPATDLDPNKADDAPPFFSIMITPKTVSRRCSCTRSPGKE